MASRSASERLLQHLEASQRLGMALETYKVRVGRAIQPQKSLPESCRVAPGTSLGHFFKARGHHFSMLLRVTNFASFFRCFFAIFQKCKKVKSTQNNAPVHGFRGSPGLQKLAKLLHFVLFLLFFRQKSRKTTPVAKKL